MGNPLAASFNPYIYAKAFLLRLLLVITYLLDFIVVTGAEGLLRRAAPF